MRRDIPLYAAFSLQASQQEFDQGNPPERSVTEKITFIMTITFPEKYEKEIAASLWAWETFGGIGARTRRGFGALQLLSINGEKDADFPAPNKQAITSWLKDKFTCFVENHGYPENVPHLDHTVQLCIVNAPQSPMGAWKQLIEKLSAFRQFPDGRDGRSKWPEAEAVRYLTRRRYKKHQPLPHPRKFPRAAFGLPIVFHFKDAKKGDPEDATLQGLDMDRLSSPLILRPLPCSDGKAVGLALLLKGTQTPSNLVLVEKKGESHPANAKLEPREANMIEPLHGQQDVLQTFMNYLGGNIQWNRD
jgi:CRISPR-associated protein Cmr1